MLFVSVEIDNSTLYTPCLFFVGCGERSAVSLSAFGKLLVNSTNSYEDVYEWIMSQKNCVMRKELLELETRGATCRATDLKCKSFDFRSTFNKMLSVKSPRQQQRLWWSIIADVRLVDLGH